MTVLTIKHRYFVLLLALAAVLAFLPGTVLAQNQEESCEEVFVEAEERYIDGAFSETVRLLSDCYYREDLPPELSVEIVRLVALAHLGNDDLELARRAVLRILSFDAGYEADPVQDPPNYASMVSIVRQQVRAGELEIPEVAEESPSRGWLYVVGGALFTGAVTAAVTVFAGSGGGSSGDALPEPPNMP